MYANKMIKCGYFFGRLAKELGDSYEVIGSCNKDASAYLIPKGTESQISYYGKPALSFRVSDHWNWYSSTKKCKDETYIQCYSIDLPHPRKRPAKGKASKPIVAAQVAMIGPDGNYHHIYGDKFNGLEWRWVETDIDDIIAKITVKEN